jgi:hypothetical protein
VAKWNMRRTKGPDLMAREGRKRNFGAANSAKSIFERSNALRPQPGPPALGREVPRSRTGRR